MVRRAERAPVTAKMYRHFAAVTLVVTLGMAMFARGESPEAIARDVGQSDQHSQSSNPNELIRKDNPTRGSFGTDEWVDGGYSRRIEAFGALGHGAIPGRLEAEPEGGMPVGHTVYGVSAATWKALSDEERKSLIAAHEAVEASARTPERGKELEALLAASRARSGVTAAVPD